METNECSLAVASNEAAARREWPLPKQREILVPIDFSEPSVTALRHARTLADGQKAHVILLNVVEEPGSFRTMDAVGQRRVRFEQRAERLQALADRELGPKVATRIEVREGKPATEITRLASRRHVDLIVVGQHSHRGLWRWVQGHTASKLSKTAPCPVLLLKGGHRLN